VKQQEVPDTVVAGRYRLVGALASGSTSSVWRAVDLETGGDVAIKMLRDGADEALRDRGRREAVILAGLHHPNLVRVLDGGEADGVPYTVMALLDGEPLNRIIEARGTIPAEEAVALVADVADGLGEAHRRGVIHRDVKPGNIVCDGEVPTLVDFGIARSLDATTLTSGLVVGTASYLAPEQAQGGDLGPPCDVYALGCVLYELLTGRPPFTAPSPVAVAMQHVQDEPRPPAELVAVPAAVNTVVLRCLAKDPTQRPADGTALATALRAAVAAGEGDGEETVTLAPVGAAGGTMVMPAVAAEDPLIDPAPLPPVPPPPPRERRSPLILLGVLAAVVVAGLALLAGGRGRGAPTQEVPDVTGAPVADAIAYLEGAGFRVEVLPAPADAPEGTVLASEPPAGATAARGSLVHLNVSTGAPTTIAEEPPATEAPPERDPPGRGRGRGNDDD